MHAYIAYFFTLLSALTSAGLIYLAYQYETVGHGLHPALCAFSFLILLCGAIFMLRVAPELDADPEDEGFDITNDIFVK